MEAGWRLAEDRVRLGDMGRGGTEEGGGQHCIWIVKIRFGSFDRSIQSVGIDTNLNDILMAQIGSRRLDI